MRILSIIPTHDSSVCVLNNGKLEFFCKEERLTRIKRDKNPLNSLDLYLSQNLGEIDEFIWATPSNDNFVVNDTRIKNCFTDVHFSNHLFKKLKKPIHFKTIGHHLSHATLAFVNSGFKEAIVVVIDHNGNIVYINNDPVARESESVYLFHKDHGERAIHKSYWSLKSFEHKKIIRDFIEQQLPDCYVQLANELGLVRVYEAATTLIGQRPLENGKTMGLSSYGEDKEYEPLFFNNQPITNQFEAVNGLVCFDRSSHLITKDVNEENYQMYANRAKQVQVQTQQVALNLIKKYVDSTGIKNVCLVGGYALNVVANNFYLKNLPEVNFYFEPTADDTGCSIGAAMAVHYRETGEWAAPLVDNFYHHYQDEELNIGTKSSIQNIVSMLLEGKVIALFEGSPEAGPRALGHRSILFDPRNQDAKQIVNKIKNREWYRPFAGVILESEFEKYFETMGLKQSPYMTINFEAKDHTKKLVPGIIHVDGTCRVQTVTSGTLFEILKLFYKKTKCPMLLNTSFNLAGEPLVHTRQDAIKTFERSDLDAIYFADSKKIVSK